MGDFVALLRDLNLSPVNTLILAVILYFVWRLFDKFAALESTQGPLRRLEDRIDEHDVTLAVNTQRLNTLEAGKRHTP